MLDFILYTKTGTITVEDRNVPEPPVNADESVIQITLNDAPVPLSRSNIKRQNTVGYKLAQIRRLNADIDVVFYGSEEQGREIVHAFSMARGYNGPFSILNYAESAQGAYVGKFDSKEAFLKSLFVKGKQEWLYDCVNWTPELIDKAMSGRIYHDGHVFLKR